MSDPRATAPPPATAGQRAILQRMHGGQGAQKPASQRKTPPQRTGWHTFWRVCGTLAMTLIVVAAAAAYPLWSRGWGWLKVDWQHTWVLFFLLLIPLVWWWTTFGQDWRRPRLRMGTVQSLRRAPRGIRVRLRDLPGIVRAAALAFLVMALARPVSIWSDDTTTEEGIDIVVVMDLSGSMAGVLDADSSVLPRPFDRPKGRLLTRLDTAKVVVKDFVGRRQTDRIGVIVFGRSAFILSPPTLDYQLLSKLVSKLSLEVIDGSKTAIGDAVGTAVARLRHSDASSKVIILLTDGDNNAGKVSPDLAIKLANRHGAKVYTIQIGDGAEVKVQRGTTLFGKPHYVRRRFPTNPELLQRIAKQTGAEAFIATDAKALRESMHAILNKLEKTSFEASSNHVDELFALLLIPGVLLLGFEALLRALLLRRFP